MAEGQIGVNMGKMYDGEIYEKVSLWFDGHREEMTEDIKRLVRIPSISEPEAEQGPFGQGCRDALYQGAGASGCA